MSDLIKRAQQSVSGKVLFIAALILLLLIPMSMIKGVVNERVNLLRSARADIASAWGNAQTIGGPIFVMPYRYTRLVNGIAVTAHSTSISTTAKLSDFDLVTERAQPLVVSILEPSEGTVFEYGETATVFAEVSEPSLTSQIELLVDGAVIGQDTSPPYLFLWSGAEVGAHTVQARAVDMYGVTFGSELIAVTIRDSMRLASMKCCPTGWSAGSSAVCHSSAAASTVT